MAAADGREIGGIWGDEIRVFGAFRSALLLSVDSAISILWPREAGEKVRVVSPWYWYQDFIVVAVV